MQIIELDHQIFLPRFQGILQSHPLDLLCLYSVISIIIFSCHFICILAHINFALAPTYLHMFLYSYLTTYLYSVWFISLSVSLPLCIFESFHFYFNLGIYVSFYLCFHSTLACLKLCIYFKCICLVPFVNGSPLKTVVQIPKSLYYLEYLSFLLYLSVFVFPLSCV